MNQGYISLKDVEIFVLDEADRMLDMGFIHDVRRIIASLPQKRQSLFFSATMPPEIVKLAGSIVYKPVKVEVTPSASTVDIVNQFVYFIDKGNKNALLIELLKDEKIKTALVFTRTKFGADKVVKVFRRKISVPKLFMATRHKMPGSGLWQISKHRQHVFWWQLILQPGVLMLMILSMLSIMKSPIFPKHMSTGSAGQAGQEQTEQQFLSAMLKKKHISAISKNLLQKRFRLLMIILFH